MALRGFTRSMNRHGSWLKRLAVGGDTTPQYAPLYIQASSEPTVAGIAGDVYVDTNGTLYNNTGTSWVPVAHRIVSVTLPEHTDCIDQAVFIADRAYVVERIDYIHSTAGTDSSAVNVQVKKCTGTQAPDAGTNLLTNNTSAGFNCKATINTVQNGTLTATTATKTLAAGNRLSVDFTGSTTALAGVSVTIVLRPI